MTGTAAEHWESAQIRTEMQPVSPSHRALIRDVGFIALVPDSWHWQWQPRHQVMSRLANYFPVVWMNPAHYWRKSFRLAQLSPDADVSRIPQQDFVVHTSSLFWPLFYSPSAVAAFTLRRRLAAARKILSRRGCKKIGLYLWRPEFAPAMSLIPTDFSFYHIDDEYTFSSVESPVSAEERDLIAAVDHVFIHSPALLEKKGQINPHTSFVPNGVDFEAYSRRVPEPEDLRSLPHPRIGYSGHIKRQLDWPLLRELATRHPEWFFVFVGAANAHPEILAYTEELSRLKNVKFLGSKTASELAAYPQHFDVCIMPYKKDDYTKYIYPLKLHEYLAGGKPVVGTPIPSLVPFREAIRLPESSEDWPVAIAESVHPQANTVEARTARQALARAQDWNLLVRQIARIMAGYLGPQYVDLLDQAVL